jgi:hypothetical protein
MFSVINDDPRSTAAAALSLAAGLSPGLDAAVSGLPGHDASAALACLAGHLEGPRLFEDRTLAALRRLCTEIEAGVRRETAPAVTWAPVRYVDGVEEFEPVTVVARTPQGDALAATAAQLSKLVTLIERTQTLLAADKAIAHLRQDPDGPARFRASRPSGTGPASGQPGGA